MYLILLAAGVLAVLLGIALVAAAVPIVDLAAATLFTSGTMALMGGLLLAGLALAVRKLGRIAERLDIQPMPVPPIASVNRDDPAPRPIRAPAPLAAAPAPVVESPRPGLLGWFGGGKAAKPVEMKPVQAPGAEQAPPPRDVQPPAPVDLGPLARIPEPPREAPPISVAPPAAPPQPTPAPAMRLPPKVAALVAASTPVPKPAAQSAPANSTAGTTVYRSGVIDGMAYTLFMDGSIQAELPQGLVKFATIDELQQYLTGPR